MPVPRTDHPLGNPKDHSKDRQDFEDLLQRAATLLHTPVNSPQPYPRREFSRALGREATSASVASGGQS